MGRAGQFDPSFDIPSVKLLLNVSDGFLMQRCDP